VLDHLKGFAECPKKLTKSIFLLNVSHAILPQNYSTLVRGFTGAHGIMLEWAVDSIAEYQGTSNGQIH
jgi:hypothetical protein